MARAGSQRVIQINDDSIAFYKYCITERPTAEDLEDMVDVFAEANADTLSYDSKVVEVAVSSRRRQCDPGNRHITGRGMPAFAAISIEGYNPIHLAIDPGCNPQLGTVGMANCIPRAVEAKPGFMTVADLAALCTRDATRHSDLMRGDGS
mgnify:CR=1 FL=1